MRFILFGNTYQSKKSVHIQRFFYLCHELGIELYVDAPFYDFIKQELHAGQEPAGVFTGDDFWGDIAVSLGGDGTFLQAASRIGPKEIPILGINTGRLGFLADTSPDDMEEMLHHVLEGTHSVRPRKVLQTILEGEHTLQSCPYALNEVAVLKRDISSMITIHTEVNGEYLNTYQADGLIVATPTGSTAYSLSVGGPIMVPQTDILALTPVAPHSLSMRPIVMRDDAVVKLDIKSRSHNFLIAIDGRSEGCEEGVQLTIRKADYVVKIVQQPDSSFFGTLRTKMMWGADARK